MLRPALKATGLRKSFGEKTALDGIDLDVAEGSICRPVCPHSRSSDTAGR
jgi:ABC-2 type transport system ATP-binding protein